MGFTQKLGLLAQGVYSDSSLNVGIGGAPSGSYKFETTGTAKISSTLLVSGVVTFGSTLSNGTYSYTLPGATGTLALTSDIHSAVTLSAIGSTANANGATLTGQVLNLQPADASFGGVVTTGTQTFAGAKTFSSQLTLSSTISNGTYTYTLPSATGTLALTSALTGYLPLTGGTLTGALSGTSATFSQGISADVGSATSSIQVRNASTDAPFIGFFRGGTLRNTLQLLTDGSFKLTDASLVANAGLTMGALSGTSATFSGAINLTGTANSFQVASIFRNANRVFFGGDTGGYFFQNSSNTTTLLTITDAGAATFSGKNLINIGTSGATASTNADGLTINNSGNGGLSILTGASSSGYLAFGSTSSNIGGLFQYDHSDNGFKMRATEAGSYLQFHTAGTDRITITSGGNVLIGTTTDSGYKLQVSGTFYSSAAISCGTSISASTTVTGPQGVRSESSSLVIPFTTWTTITTVDSNTMGMYLVVIGLANQTLSDWSATGILYSSGLSATWINGPTNGVLVQLRISGTSIQVFQSGGSPSQTLSYKLLKIM